MRQGRPDKPGVIVADHIGGTVTHAKPPTGQADLAQHRSSRHQRPEWLLATVRTLQRPGHVDHGARARHLARQLHDALGRNPGQSTGPLGMLGLPITTAQKIGLHLLEAHAMAGQKGPVQQIFTE